MKSVRVYQAFVQLGLPAVDANEVVAALEERDSEAATRADLLQLKVEMMEKLESIRKTVVISITTATALLGLLQVFHK